MRIELISKSVYGVVKFYPANEEAKVIAEIAGQKTISPAMIALCRKLNAEIVDVSPRQVPQ